ncbi:MAG: transposase [Burkholderia sp.]
MQLPEPARWRARAATHCAPALQRAHVHACFLRDIFNRCALRRQQPFNHLVLECLSVLCHFSSSLCPWISRSYSGDNYSDTGSLEAINGLFQATKRKARGYTNLTTIRNVLFLIAGKLDFSKINPHVP